MYKKFIILFFLNICLIQIAPENLKELKRPSIAIIPVYYHGLDSLNFNLPIIELITGQFIKSNNFLVVERNDIEKVINELKIQNSNFFDETSVVRLGNYIGAQYILISKLSPFNSNYFITAKIVSVKDGIIKNSYSTKNVTKEDIISSFESLAKKLAFEFNEAGPVEQENEYYSGSSSEFSPVKLDYHKSIALNTDQGLLLLGQNGSYKKLRDDYFEYTTYTPFELIISRLSKNLLDDFDESLCSYSVNVINNGTSIIVKGINKNHELPDQYLSDDDFLYKNNWDLYYTNLHTKENINITNDGSAFIENFLDFNENKQSVLYCRYNQVMQSKNQCEICIIDLEGKSEWNYKIANMFMAFWYDKEGTSVIYLTQTVEEKQYIYQINQINPMTNKIISKGKISIPKSDDDSTPKLFDYNYNTKSFIFGYRWSGAVIQLYEINADKSSVKNLSDSINNTFLVESTQNRLYWINTVLYNPNGSSIVYNFETEKGNHLGVLDLAANKNTQLNNQNELPFWFNDDEIGYVRYEEKYETRKVKITEQMSIDEKVLVDSELLVCKANKNGKLERVVNKIKDSKKYSSVILLLFKHAYPGYLACPYVYTILSTGEKIMIGETIKNLKGPLARGEDCLEIPLYKMDIKQPTLVISEELLEISYLYSIKITDGINELAYELSGADFQNTSPIILKKGDSITIRIKSDIKQIDKLYLVVDGFYTPAIKIDY